MLKIESLLLGHMKNLVHIIIDEESKEAAVVDPAWDVPRICDILTKNKATLTKILLTHCHFDHIEGLEELLLYKTVPVYMSSNERIQNYPKGLTVSFVKDGDKIFVGKTEFSVKNTPGHSVGSLCFYSEPHLITGDTLFVNGCGCCDLAGSTLHDMYESLLWIKSLAGNTIIYPGHHYAESFTDTLANQRETNRFLRCESREEFVRLRMA
jgi:glyoxylase-like metal-dependent hydrolase (beta-lactamase superfamily II)